MFLLLACAPDPAAYEARKDALICRRYAHCVQEEFDDLFSSVAECEADWAASAPLELACRAETCTFDPAGARQCLSALRWAACSGVAMDAAVEECEEAWADCDYDAYRDCRWAAE